MDAFSHPRVETIVLCFAAQCGKTEVLLNSLGFAVDREPGPVMVVYPNEEIAKRVFSERVRPMLQQSPALARQLTGDPDDLGMTELRLLPCTIHAAWANSPGMLSSFPCRYVIGDEVDKFPIFSGKDANPLGLAAARTRNYRGRRKILWASTPTVEEAYIWTELQATNVLDYFVRCVHCGGFFVWDMDHLKWPAETPASKVLEEHLAWYECHHCEGRIGEQERMAMLAAEGVWVPRGSTPGDVLEGRVDIYKRRTGFRLSAFSSPWVELAEVAAAHLRSLEDVGLRMEFVNQWLALPWRDKIDVVSEAKLLARCSPYEAGKVPQGGILLTAGADVQIDRIYYSIRAWGSAECSWLVRYGTIFDWTTLERVLRTRYEGADGREYRIETALLDSGYRTDEVYRFCERNHGLVFPAKGTSDPRGPSLRIPPRARPRSGGKPHPPLFLFRTDYWKDVLARYISAKEGEPGRWLLPAVVSKDYLAQMTAEVRRYVKRGGRTISTWEPKTEKAQNHYWDTEVLNVIAADQAGVRYLDADETILEDEEPPEESPPARRRGGGWLGDGDALDSRRGGGGSFWED